MARSKKPQESQAFPQAAVVETLAHTSGPTGLTDRQFFAGMSLMGIRASGVEFDAQLAARKAFIDADAMLAEGAQS